MAISASLCWIMPNSAIDWPKALRSFAYLRQTASTFLEPPTVPGPSFSRPTLTVSMLRTHCTHFSILPLQSLVMDTALCFARLEVLCRRAEAVVGVAEFGWNAAARGTTGELDVVAPCAASRRAADAVRGALRVHGGRDGVPGRIVPIAAPLVNVLAHVEQAVAIRLAEAGGFRAVMPTAGGN